MMIYGGVTLGRSLTPFPSPRGHHTEDGPYRFVRHPIYGGVVVLATGIALTSSPVALAPALALAPFFLVKARYEERLLAAVDASYVDYCERVRRRLFPGIV
jgi:protein-S-isoprenylcysteine O-methyltransferase Ste14